MQEGFTKIQLAPINKSIPKFQHVSELREL